MYRAGHLGVSLLAYVPVGVALIWIGAVPAALLAGAAVLWLAMLPDVDHRLPLVEHRGPTHSLAFAALVGAAFAAVAVAAPTALVGELGLPGWLPLPAFGFAVGAFTVVAHLLGDALTPAGVNFLWPVSGRSYSLSLWTADNAVANYGLFGVGVFVAGAAGYLTLVWL